MSVPYYQGRPARLFTAVMSGHVRAMAAKSAATASPASPRPAARARTRHEASSVVATAASTSAWEAWAGNWFKPTVVRSKDLACSETTHRHRFPDCQACSYAG
jgi:hypothetical protein